MPTQRERLNVTNRAKRGMLSQSMPLAQQVQNKMNPDLAKNLVKTIEKLKDTSEDASTDGTCPACNGTGKVNELVRTGPALQRWSSLGQMWTGLGQM